MKTKQAQIHSTTNRFPTLSDVETFMLKHVKDNEPAEYHLKSGGKHIRAKVCLSASSALDLIPTDSLALAAACEFLHNASLVHDDLQDGDKTRRGSATVWHKFGKAQAVCTGDLLLTKAFACLTFLSPTCPLHSVLQHMQDAVSVTIKGQCEDVESLATATTVSYESIAENKSGPLLALPLVLPLICAGHESSVDLAKRSIGRFAVAYQIADDLADWKRDAKAQRVNLVNIMARELKQEEAFDSATNRALFLLKRSQQGLMSLPNQCALGMFEAADKIAVALEATSHE